MNPEDGRPEGDLVVEGWARLGFARKVVVAMAEERTLRPGTYDDALVAFDVWLDRVKAAAWDEGCSEGRHHSSNPYRKEAR